ncbi:site-2 protease family protein [Paenibacillus albiflavus]|uniref:Site-2 protease family protein n=2 Tax=Paenibacillus albiflavus TaxID=2545760 RepID=A0A4R4EDG6_9BACL|nr:site-2 protease family protein [Paenibacillus albiflavus]
MISLSVHEFAHAYSADKFGDPTPRSMGRVTLNPMRHLDVFGTLLFVVVGFGWAKPVLVNPSKFRKPRLMNAIVSVLGPISNLILGFIGMVILYVMLNTGVMNSWSKGASDAVMVFLTLFYNLNILLFILNLIPIPPLDGYRILESILPPRIMAKIRPYEQWTVYILLLLVFIPPLYKVTLGPIFSLTIPITHMFEMIIRAIFPF